ncbi:MAG: N-acetyltransferase [Acidobacteria bacterium]|nr:N-acetyltransferase [Acidobacteriota bacterium]
MADIKHIEHGGRGAFIVKIDGKRLAEMTYVTVGDTGFIIDHTEVDKSLEGQGVGKELLAAAVAHAREKGLKIYATCPFALRELTNTPEYHDVFSS